MNNRAKTLFAFMALALTGLALTAAAKDIPAQLPDPDGDNAGTISTNSTCTGARWNSTAASVESSEAFLAAKRTFVARCAELPAACRSTSVKA